LTTSQLSAVKIVPVGRSLFRDEIEATGSVNFAEDPSIVQAESTLLATAATFAAAEKELARARDLFSTKGVSERELEQAISDEQAAKAALETARNSLSVSGETDREINHIIAAGRIRTSNSDRRGFKWVLANGNESDDPSLRVGQPVRVHVDAVPDHEFTGKVTKVYAVVDLSLHRVSVRAEVKDPSDKLRSGMLADVFIEIARPTQSLSIPENAVVREGDGTMTAWVTTDRRRFVQRHIEIGAREGGQVQILKGIRIGEHVVADGAVLLDNMLQAPTGD
jgi:cobalt-zinc-cadmium efflux system membrane fusion protein